jgi:hypothetical protein
MVESGARLQQDSHALSLEQENQSLCTNVALEFCIVYLAKILPGLDFNKVPVALQNDTAIETPHDRYLWTLVHRESPPLPRTPKPST